MNVLYPSCKPVSPTRLGFGKVIRIYNKKPVPKATGRCKKSLERVCIVKVGICMSTCTAPGGRGVQTLDGVLREAVINSNVGKKGIKLLISPSIKTHRFMPGKSINTKFFPHHRFTLLMTIFSPSRSHPTLSSLTRSSHFFPAMASKN